MSKKILLMSMAGVHNKPEMTKNIHLYLASLKECVVPFFDTKVILFNSSNSSEKTIELVNKYGLSDVVEVKRLEEMNLPEKSYEFLKDMFFANRIGLIMNLMFDYAKNNNFFDAEWILQTDSDVEFLKNFYSTLETCKTIAPLNPSIVISHMGDTYEYNIAADNKIGYFKIPQRLNLYNTSEDLYEYWNRQQLKVTDLQHTNEKTTFVSQQLKIKNDFIVFSAEAARSVNFNWISSGATVKVHNATSVSFEEGVFDESWDIKDNNFEILINKDKGSLVLYEMQTGRYNVTHIQLPPSYMMNHLGAGWIHEEYYTRVLSILKDRYSQYENVWKFDFEENNEEEQTQVTQQQQNASSEYQILKNKMEILEKALNEIKQSLNISLGG